MSFSDLKKLTIVTLNAILIHELHLFFSLLVFAQKRSNYVLAILMAVSFYLQGILSVLIFHFAPVGNFHRYPLATAHPLVRLPVFFMGVCAGVLCVRSQQGDIDAFQSMGK